MAGYERRHYFSDFIKATINPPVTGDPYEKESKIFDYFIFFIIAANVFILVIETESDIYDQYAYQFDQFNRFFTALFTVEYLMRLYACDHIPAYSQPFWGRIKYIFSVFALIDLVCILPALLFPGGSNLGTLRLLRIFRLLKIVRLSGSADIIVRVIVKKRNELFSIFFSVILLIVFASSFIYYFEHEAQPKEFSSIIGSVWWAVITLTTIGYGDVYPITPSGKFLAGFIALLGIGLVSLPSGIIASGFHEEYQSKKEGRLTNMEYNNHLVICYWDNKLHNSVKKILDQNPGLQVVLLAELDTEANHQIRDLLSEQKNFFFNRGKPSDMDSLSKAGIENAKTVLIASSHTNTATDILFTAGLIESIDQKINTTLLVEDSEAARAFETMQTKFHIDQILCIEDLVYPHLAGLLIKKDKNALQSESIEALGNRNLLIKPVFELIATEGKVTFKEVVLACLDQNASFLCLKMKGSQEFTYTLDKDEVVPRNAEVYLTQA